MSNGTLGKAMSIANAYVTAYTAPASVQFSSIQIECLNTDPSVTASIFMAVTLTPGAPGILDHVEYGTNIAALGGSLERTSLLMSPNESIVVKANTATVAVRVSGLEQY